MQPDAARSWTEQRDLVAFYMDHRDEPDDMYPSERRFLPWLASRVGSVLDVGCASGGFSNIWRAFRPGISYTGVDVSEPLIQAARRLHPDLKFLAGDCAAGLSLSSDYAEVVQALGWLHWETRYRQALRELWRLTDRYLFFDVRLVEGQTDATDSRQQLAWLAPWDGETTVPYICVGWSAFAPFLLDLRPAALFGYGYWGDPAPTVMGPRRRVYFATFVLKKPDDADGGDKPTVCVGPMAWPADAPPGPNVLPAGDLETLVPR